MAPLPLLPVLVSSSLPGGDDDVRDGLLVTDGQGGQAVRVFSPHSYPKEFFPSTASSLLFQARAVHASPQDPALYSPDIPVPHPTFEREPPQPGPAGYQ